VIHASVVLLAIGVAGSSAYGTEREQRLRPGQSMTVGAYTLHYRGVAQRQGANDREIRAFVDVRRNGHSLGLLTPGKNIYQAEQQVSNEMAIRSDWLTGEDLDLIADQINNDGTVYFKVLVKPLVNLIWIAGVVFLGGSLIALWPDAREQRRLAARYSRQPAAAEA